MASICTFKTMWLAGAENARSAVFLKNGGQAKCLIFNSLSY
jgi:hypothetical protein